jgi:omega-6 fatty acid desaturase (delta-12 desaturase)
MLIPEVCSQYRTALSLPVNISKYQFQIKIMENINSTSSEDREWQQSVLKYATPDLRKSIWQIINSLVPYLIIWYLMYKSLAYPYWITLLLSLLATGFLIRIFIIFHDCGHRSFFKSAKANKIVGMIMGIIVYTPYHKWHEQHRIHHATSANLDKRGIGDVWTMTVEEYQNSSARDRLVYRVFRNPFVLFLLGPLLVVLMQNRITNKTMNFEQKRNVWFTNIILLLIAFLISAAIGLKAFLLIQVPIIYFGHSLGLWLFYIQHQFEDVVWERQSRWSYKESAVKGSSFLKLPGVFQWFTGNTGFHHVHHLSSKIPNYNLERCHYENEMFNEVKPIMLLSTFKALHLNLWDEANRQMVRFRDVAVSKIESGFKRGTLEVQ